MPARRQFRTIAEIPREMIGGGINKQEQRPLAMLTRDDVRRLIKIKTIRLKPASPQVLHIEIAFNARRRLKTTRAQKCAVEWIKAEGLVPQRVSALGSPRAT